MVSQGPGSVVVTLGNYYLENGQVTLRLQPQVAGSLALAYDAVARRALPVAHHTEGATVAVPLARQAVKVVVLRTAPATP